MKTVIIYDQCGYDAIKFYVVPGDYSHLNGIYVNNSMQPEHLTEELCNLFYDPVSGEELLTPEVSFPYSAISREHAKIIVAGFLP